MRAYVGMRRLAALAIIAGLAGCGQGSKAPDAADVRAAAEAAYEAALAEAEASRGPGEPAVWLLQDEDTRLYIMGTVHLLRPDLDWRSETIDAALESADTLVLETDVTSQAAASAMMQFISKQGLFQDGRQLTSLLTDTETQELQAALDYVDIPLGAVQPMRPWYAAVNLSVLQIKKEGFDPASGVELVLEAEAREDGKSFAYLETIDEQLGRLADLPDDVQVDFLIRGRRGARCPDRRVGGWRRAWARPADGQSGNDGVGCRV